MGGFMLYKDDRPDHVVPPSELEKYIISREISITRTEIQDRSKGDVLTKGFVLIQTSWFILQMAARTIEHLPISELEIVTLAFATLNFVTYGLWWHKPLNVKIPVQVGKCLSTGNLGPIEEQKYLNHFNQVVAEGNDGETTPTGSCDRAGHTILSYLWSKVRRSFRPPLVAHARATVSDFWNELRSAFRPPKGSYFYAVQKEWWTAPFLLAFAPFGGSVVRNGDKRVPTFFDGKEPYDDVGWVATLVSFGLAAIFGAVHCIAWPFQFPTLAEALIWRTASVTIVVSPLLVVFAVCVIMLEVPRGATIVSILVYWVSLALYPIARVVLLVLPFVLLRSLPPDTYTTVRWTTFIPHV